jgi:hypothetical protein
LLLCRLRLHCDTPNAGDLTAPASKEKRRDGGSRRGAKERTPGKSCSQFLSRSYLETLMAWIAASCARASRASIGAKVTLPPRRRRTSIPAIAGRTLATPCACGRMSVTVDLAITELDKATAVPARRIQENQVLEMARA